jgi:hypothetical protein
MSIGRINGPMLQPNLERQGVNIALDANLTYWDVNNRYVGINTTAPAYALDLTGNAHLGNLYIKANVISTDPGYKLNLGNIANINIAGGTSGYIVSTDGAGTLTFVNPSAISSSIIGNAIALGANISGQLVSNAVTLTTSTDVTDAIAQLNAILGKLVPTSPPNFPNSTTLTLSTATSSGLMCNFVQTDNSGWGNLSVSGGTLVSATRVATLATNTIANSGTTPSGGNVQLFINGNIGGGNSYHVFGASPTSADNGTYGNLVISGTQDYHNIVSTVTAGFWNVFSASVSATSGIPAGWNRANIVYTGSGTQTNTIQWYYDNSAPSAPAFTSTNMVLSSNVVSYSSTIPMFTTSAGFTLTGSVRNISGDTYPNSTNLISASSANGAFAAPAFVSYATAGVTTPISRGNTALIAFTTTSNITSGFGNALASQGPSITVNNNYNSTAWAFSPAGATYILYKTGTGTAIEETSISVGTTGTLASGSGNGFRISNPGSTDNPSFTGSEAAFNSTTGPFYTYDVTNVGAKLQFDKTNYSTGFLPVGPDLSGQASSQYFTFKFNRLTVSKFDVLYSGTIAGLWVALPGSSIMTTASPTNGWLDVSTAYAGAGVPGTGSGGNGSAGCAVSGTAVLNSLQSNKSVTATFGSVQSNNSGTNNGDIYVRVKLTSGQNLTALSIVTASH